MEYRQSDKDAPMFVAYEHVHITHSGHLVQKILARLLEDDFLLFLDDVPHMNNSQATKDYIIARNDQLLSDITKDNNDAEPKKLLPTETIRTTFLGY